MSIFLWSVMDFFTVSVRSCPMDFFYWTNFMILGVKYFLTLVSFFVKNKRDQNPMVSRLLISYRSLIDLLLISY